MVNGVAVQISEAQAVHRAVAITCCRSTCPGCASARHYNVVSKAFRVLKYEMFVILYGSVVRQERAGNWRRQLV